jgi:hypothetical protein
MMAGLRIYDSVGRDVRTLIPLADLARSLTRVEPRASDLEWRVEPGAYVLGGRAYWLEELAGSDRTIVLTDVLDDLEDLTISDLVLRSTDGALTIGRYDASYLGLEAAASIVAACAQDFERVAIVS